MADYSGAHTGAEVDDGVGVAKASGTGLLAKTGTGAGATRTLTGTSDQIDVADGDGVSGNPVLSLAATTLALLTLAGTAVQPASLAGYVAVDSDASLRSLTLSGQSLTGSDADGLIDASTTWNTTGSPTAVKLNVTNTASGSTAKLLDMQVGGTSLYNIDKGGFHTLDIAPTNNTPVMEITSQRVGDTYAIKLNANGNGAYNGDGYGMWIEASTAAMYYNVVRENSPQYGMYGFVGGTTATNSAIDDFGSNYYYMQAKVNDGATHNYGYMYGTFAYMKLYSGSSNTSVLNMTAMVGVWCDRQLYGANYSGSPSQINLTDDIGVYVDHGQIYNSGAGMTIDNKYGIKIEDQGNYGTNVYGVWIDATAGGSASDQWALYVNEGESYFGGQIQVSADINTASFPPLSGAVGTFTNTYTGGKSSVGVSGVATAAKYGYGGVFNGTYAGVYGKGETYGGWFNASPTTSGPSRVYGITGTSWAYEVNINQVRGLYFSAGAFSYSGGTVSGSYLCGTDSYVDLEAGGAGSTISYTNAYGYKTFAIFSKDSGATVTLTNLYGLYVDVATVYSSGGTLNLTNHYGVYVETLTEATNNYGIYVEGNKSYFGGQVQAHSDTNDGSSQADAATGYFENTYSAGSNYSVGVAGKATAGTYGVGGYFEGTNYGIYALGANNGAWIRAKQTANVSNLYGIRGLTYSENYRATNAYGLYFYNENWIDNASTLSMTNSIACQLFNETQARTTSGGSWTITNTIGVSYQTYARADTGCTVTITNDYAFQVLNASITGSGTTAITNAYGLYIADLTYAANNWAIYVAGGNSRLDDLEVAGSVVMMANLPTSDPSNTGQLWNDGGIVTVS